MTTFLSGRRHEIPSSLFDELCRYRHEIFVRNLGWSLPSRGGEGFELDEFDGSDAVYVIALREDGTICGTARLLPTTRPYLLEVLFPELAPVLPRRSPAIWELSRFASTAPSRTTAAVGRPSASIFAEALQVARNRGATTLVGAVSRPLERLLRGIGLRTQRLAAERRLAGEVVVPCSVEMNAHDAWLRAARSRASHTSSLSRAPSRRREGDAHVAVGTDSIA